MVVDTPDGVNCKERDVLLRSCELDEHSKAEHKTLSRFVLDSRLGVSPTAETGYNSASPASIPTHTHIFSCDTTVGALLLT